MTRTPSLAVVALLVATAGSSLAQPVPSAPSGGAPAYGYTPPPGTPVTPDNQGRQGAVPAVGQQIQAARSVDSTQPGRQPAELLRQADRALRQHKLAAANELLERAQTASLNGQAATDSAPAGSIPAGSTPAGSASGMAAAIGAARQAVVDGDMARAHQQIAQALGTDPAAAPRPGRRRQH